MFVTERRYTGMKILSWNVNGLRAVWKKGFVDIVKKENPDMLLLQEIKADKTITSNGDFDIPGYTLYTHNAIRKGYAGTAIYTKTKPISAAYDSGNADLDREGRILTLEYDKFYLINTYLPHSGRELVNIDKKSDFNDVLLKYCEKFRKKKPVIIGGDLNVAHKDIDLANPKGNKKKFFHVASF